MEDYEDRILEEIALHISDRLYNYCVCDGVMEIVLVDCVRAVYAREDIRLGQWTRTDSPYGMAGVGTVQMQHRLQE